MYGWGAVECDWEVEREYYVPTNNIGKPQVVAATQNRPLSRKREPESDPARLVV